MMKNDDGEWEVYRERWIKLRVQRKQTFVKKDGEKQRAGENLGKGRWEKIYRLELKVETNLEELVEPGFEKVWKRENKSNLTP